LRERQVITPLRTFGIPQQFLDHAKRPQILTDLGLTASALDAAIADAFHHATSVAAHGSHAK
jgi:1-deoxy-D-xylulose-5-phosphate synthase